MLQQSCHYDLSYILRIILFLFVCLFVFVLGVRGQKEHWETTATVQVTDYG